MTQPNRRIGDYDVDSEIARGGFGSIYRAFHKDTRHAVAIKILHREHLAERTIGRRFEREAAIVFGLAHPNITQIHAWGRLDDARPYIIMEMLEGQSLDKLLATRQRLSVDETIAILEPVANALEWVHARAIVHRDIKPANVFLAPDRAAGHVVLLDFGIARFVSGDGPVLTTSRASLGTIPFMAPEQILGEPVDARADVYALAATAYAMLSGAPPFGTQTTSILRQIHLHTRPPRPSSRAPIDPMLDESILRALSRNPSERFASPREFVAALSQAIIRKPPSQSFPNGIVERSAIAVYVEVRKSERTLAPDEETLLDAVEMAMKIICSELIAAGLVLVRESTKMLLAVSPEPPDAARLNAVHAACIRAYRRVVEASGEQRCVDVGIFMHCGALHTNEAGTLLPSGLLDVASWAPTAALGVAASRAALTHAPTNLEPVTGKHEFFWMERS